MIGLGEANLIPEVANGLPRATLDQLIGAGHAPGVGPVAERFAEALYEAGRAGEALEALSPFSKMPPESMLPGASEIGKRVAASLARYRAAAEPK